MKRVVLKMKNRAGFSLTEVLAAVLILVMISASALPAAMKAYHNAVDAANAHVLLSTTVDALRGELSTAWNVTVDNNSKTITYQSSDTGSQSVISLAEAPFTIQEYNDFSNTWLDEKTISRPDPRPLVSKAMTYETRDPHNEMKVVINNSTGIIKNDNGCVVIKGLEVQRGGTTITKMPDSGLLIRYLGRDESA